MQGLTTAAALCHDSYGSPVGYKDVGDLRYGIVQEDGQHYLVFRGTANMLNGIRDIRCLPTRSKGGYLVHRGFASALDRLYMSVCHTIPVRARQDLVVTGHSLGGAVALLFAEVYGCKAVTFGCPRVYWRWGRAPAGLRHDRVVCDDDPVPMIPRFLYRHLADPAMVLCDRDGGIDVADHSIAVYCKRLEAVHA